MEPRGPRVEVAQSLSVGQFEHHGRHNTSLVSGRSESGARGPILAGGVFLPGGAEVRLPIIAPELIANTWTRSKGEPGGV